VKMEATCFKYAFIYFTIFFDKWYEYKY